MTRSFPATRCELLLLSDGVAERDRTGPHLPLPCEVQLILFTEQECSMILVVIFNQLSCKLGEDRGGMGIMRDRILAPGAADDGPI